MRKWGGYGGWTRRWGESGGWARRWGESGGWWRRWGELVGGKTRKRTKVDFLHPQKTDELKQKLGIAGSCEGKPRFLLQCLLDLSSELPGGGEGLVNG